MQYSDTLETRRLGVETNWVTERGPVRDQNEDSVCVQENPDRPEKGTLLVVSDGMGGMDYGEFVSETITAVLPELYVSSNQKNAADALLHAIHEINLRVRALALSMKSAAGMGATVVASAIIHNAVVTVNVGDSRAYLLHRGELRQLTRDHSLGSSFGLFSSRKKNFSHVLTQAIGPREHVSPHINISSIAPGDMLLLCSDGLTSAITDEDIRRMMLVVPFADLSRSLFNKAVEKGSTDNISVICSRVEELE